MKRFLARRILLEMLPTLLAVVTLTWWMVRLAPGDPFSNERNLTDAAREQMAAYYGFDRPLPLQYAGFLGRALRGDLGYSFTYPDRRVSDIIAEQFPTSLQLGLLALLFGLLVGLPTGTLAAAWHNRPADHVVMTPALIGICLPSFVTGPLLLFLFANGQLWENPPFLPSGWGTWRTMVLPVVTLGAGLAAYLARLMRAGMLEVSTRPHVRTALAKGAGPLRVWTVHLLRSGIRPVVSFLGPAAAGLLTGSVVVETIFEMPGLGRTLINAVTNRDYGLLLGITVFYAAIILCFNAAVDLALAWLDPRQEEAT